MAWRAVTDNQWAYILTHESSALKNKDEESRLAFRLGPLPQPGFFISDRGQSACHRNARGDWRDCLGVPSK
jgi:hypothetical protein